MTPSSLRYFLVVGLHPAYVLAILAGVFLVGLWTIRLNPGELDSGLGMVLFVQMFLASSGFLVRARRGHFDAVLTCASDRRRVVVMHFLVSVFPGALACILLAAAAHAAGGRPTLAATVGRVAALFMVSALAWTAGFFLSRGAAGAVWIVTLLVVLLRRVDLVGSVSLATASPLIVLRHAATVMLCPFLLLGTRAALAPGAMLAAVSLTAVLLLSVWRMADRLDLYLVDRA